MDERTKKLRKKWDDVILDTHNKGSGIIMDYLYFEITSILVARYISGSSLSNSEAELVTDEIIKREKRFKTL